MPSSPTDTTKRCRYCGSETPDGTPKWMRQNQVPDHYPLGERMVSNMIASGRLPAHKVGKLVLVSSDDLERFIRSHDAKGRVIESLTESEAVSHD